VLTQPLIQMLWCPTCQAAGLRRAEGTGPTDPCLEGELACDGCGAIYPVHAGIPALMPQIPLTSNDWQVWERHLQKFQARREQRIAHPDPVTQLAQKQSRPLRPFAKFTGITEGTVLDVGCGPGKFRLNFDPSRVTYVGLDPIVLPEVTDFPFVHGLAEYLPFRTSTFSHIVVLAALDHFREVDRFFDEARRTLMPGGRLHILQSVHDVSGPISAVKMLTHKVKDGMEERWTRVRAHDAPKHLSEFTSESLLARANRYFKLVSQECYSPRWYTQDKLFLSLVPSTPKMSGSAAR
jgi:SAM-dependent methyltransferase